MNILYDQKTLEVQCVFYYVAEVTDRFHDTLPNMVRHPERLELDEIHLDPHPTEPGKAVVSKKQTIAAVVTASQIKIGAEVLIANVPEGVTITSNGAELGTMDASGQLEFTPQTAGHYSIKLSKRGFKTQELTVEAVA